MPRTGPTPAALALLETLIDRRTATLRDVSDEVALAGIRELEKRGEAATVPHLMLLVRRRATSPAKSSWGRLTRLVGGEPPNDGVLSAVGEAAATVAARLVVAASPSALVRLDRQLRSSWRWGLSVGWTEVEAFAAKSGVETSIGLHGLACSHPDGHVRERAVRKLIGMRTGAELPFLLLRLDDWVQPVRQLALAAVHSRLVPAYAPVFIRYLSVISSLALRQRASETKLSEWVRRWLLGAEFANLLRGALRDEDRDVRLAALALCAESEHLAPREVVEVALDDQDLLVRLRAAQFGAAKLQGDDERWFIDKACRDAHARIRSDGLDKFVARAGENPRPRLERALLDGAEAVRSTARFHLKKLGVTDLGAFYRKALTAEGQGPSVLKAALAGLAQTGTVDEDLGRIEPLLEHASGGVARAAFEAMAKLDKEVARRLALDLLRDGRPGIARVAAGILRRRTSDADAEALWRVVVEAPLVQARCRALALLKECSWWVAFPMAVRASTIGDDFVRAAAVRELSELLRARRFALYAPPSPSPAQLATCKEAFDASSAKMEPALRRAVEQVLLGDGSAVADDHHP